MLITIDDALPEMELLEDVLLPNGTTLINASTVLTESLIETLKKYKIERIQVTKDSLSLKKEEDTDENDLGMELDPDDLLGNTEDGEENLDAMEDLMDKELTPPTIGVSVNNNAMAAYLVIEPTEKIHLPITVDDLRNALAEEGVIFGVKEELLTEAVEKWQQKQQVYEYEGVACGIKPMPAKENELELLVEYISSAKGVEQAQSVNYCWELAGSKLPIQQVDKGTVLAQKEMLTPTIPGKTVRGDDVETDEVIKVEVKIATNVEENKESGEYISTTTGLTYYIDNVIGVLPMNFNGFAELSVSQDNLTAELSVHPAMERGSPPTMDEVRKLFIENQIKYGVKEKLLGEIFEKISQGEYPQEPIVIAEGAPPIPGEDGRIEYSFRTETSLKPQLDASGKADFKNVSIIQAVTEGDELARVIEPTQGAPGKDISGKEIPCTDGVEVTLPVGANTGPKPDDDTVLIALTDGNVRLKGQTVEIFEGFVVKGDVDYSTGNINYGKSVTINGDVKAGFNVTCGGDLEVRGTIEDSLIYVGGSLLCRAGFIGHSKGIVESKGDVNVSFTKNQTIYSRGNVIVAREALNSKIFSRKSIVVSGKTLSIAGGSLIARDSITCNVIGNHSGIQTMLEVGLDYVLVNEMRKTAEQASEIKVNMKKLMVSANRFEHMLEKKIKLTPKEKFLYTKLKNTMKKYSQQLHQLEERRKKIEAKLYDFSRSFIKIEKSALPGTLFKIGERHFMVNEEIIGPKSVRMIDFEIKVI